MKDLGSDAASEGSERVAPAGGQTAGGWYSCEKHGVIQSFSADGKCPGCSAVPVTLESVIDDLLDRYDELSPSALQRLDELLDEVIDHARVARDDDGWLQ